MNKLTDRQKEIINEILNQEEPGDLEGMVRASLAIGAMIPEPHLRDEIGEIIAKYN